MTDDFKRQAEKLAEAAFPNRGESPNCVGHARKGFLAGFEACHERMSAGSPLAEQLFKLQRLLAARAERLRVYEEALEAIELHPQGRFEPIPTEGEWQMAECATEALSRGRGEK
jgi:hypothetical protein